MIKAVIFDMDGVIVDTEPLHAKAWEEFFKQFNIELTEKQLHGMKGLTALHILREYLPGKTEEEYKTYKQERVEILEPLEEEVKLVHGIKEFIEQLKEQGLKIGVATSSVHKRAHTVLEKSGSKHLIDIVLTGEEVTHGKPHPEIYLKTAELLGVHPDECIVFEDSFAGVESGQAAGMHVVLIMTTHAHSEMPHVEHAFNNFTEIDIKKMIAK